MWRYERWKISRLSAYKWLRCLRGFFSTSTRPANSAFSFPYRVRSRNKVGSYISLPLANRSRYCESSVYCSGREKHMMQFLVVLTRCALRQEQGLLASQHEHNIVKNGRRGTSGSPTAWNAFSKTISGAHTSSWRLQHKHKSSDWLGCVGVFNLSSYILMVRARVCVPVNTDGGTFTCYVKDTGMYASSQMCKCIIHYTAESVLRPRCIVGQSRTGNVDWTWVFDCGTERKSSLGSLDAWHWGIITF